MRKRSKSKITIDRADRSLQDAYRRKYKGELCESCLGQLFQVIHHHISKSKSNAGRFRQPINYIKLCHSCHSKIIFGDNNIVATYSIKRGKRWLEKIEKLKAIKRPYFSRGELQKIINYYKIWKKKEQPIPF